MTLNRLNIKWVLNKRLKKSLKYSKSFFKITIECSEKFFYLSEDDRSVIERYIYNKINKKKSTAELMSAVNILFSENFDKSKTMIKGFTDNCNHDLDIYLNEINQKYFNSTAIINKIVWSQYFSKRILGRYYDENKTIVISKLLNQKSVPEFVVKQIVFHEICHQLFPPRYVNSKWSIHHQQFKIEEVKYDRYELAKRWIDKKMQITLAEYLKVS